MGDRSVSRQPRYAAFVVVAALHFVLVMVLIGASRIRLRTPAAQSVITTMVSVPTAPQRLAPGPTFQPRLAAPGSLAPLVPTPPSIAYPPADNVPPQAIDWHAEAQSAAAAVTGSKGVPAVPSETQDPRKTSSSTGPRAWFPPPAHHRGEAYKTITGESIVWISDKCYVQSPAAKLGMAQILTRGMLTTTVCPRTSGKARGDLFEALPAYKKLHPEADPGK
jgi:hypothetical protein